MFAGKSSVCLDDIRARVSEEALAFYYLEASVPSLINSPFRRDDKPSFSLYFNSEGNVLYKDFATDEKGTIYHALMRLFNMSFNDMLQTVYNDVVSGKISSNGTQFGVKRSYSSHERTNDIKIDICTRKWMPWDVEYWSSFGINTDWLDYADVYPITHYFLTKNNKTSIIRAEKYAYAYVERKEGKITVKVYQPYCPMYKWPANNNDGTTIALWSKIPQQGDVVCICSSVKDALCLWSNTGVPAVALQGEGYPMSNHAINDLKSRFKRVLIILDNDIPGLEYSTRLARATGFTNVILPFFSGGKDISDYYKAINNRQRFIKDILNVIHEL